MAKSKVTFYEDNLEYRLNKDLPPSASNFDWHKYSVPYDNWCRLISYCFTGPFCRTYRRTGHNLHGARAPQVQQLMTEMIGVDRLRGSNIVKRLRDKTAVNLQPHRKNKPQRENVLNNHLKSIYDESPNLKGSSDYYVKREKVNNWWGYSIGRQGYWMNRVIGLTAKEKEKYNQYFPQVIFHDVTTDVALEIVKFIKKLTVATDYDRVFLLPAVDTPTKGHPNSSIISMNRNSGVKNIAFRAASGSGNMIVIPRGYSIPKVQVKDLCMNHVAPGAPYWRSNRWRLNGHYKALNNKYDGSPTFSLHDVRLGGYGRAGTGGFANLFTRLIHTFSGYSLKPGDEKLVEMWTGKSKIPYGNPYKIPKQKRFPTNSIFNNPYLLGEYKPENNYNDKTFLALVNSVVGSEEFENILLNKDNYNPIKPQLPSPYDNHYVEIRIKEAHTTINFMGGIDFETNQKI